MQPHSSLNVKPRSRLPAAHVTFSVRHGRAFLSLRLKNATHIFQVCPALRPPQPHYSHCEGTPSGCGLHILIRYLHNVFIKGTYDIFIQLWGGRVIEHESASFCIIHHERSHESHSEGGSESPCMAAQKQMAERRDSCQCARTSTRA